MTCHRTILTAAALAVIAVGQAAAQGEVNLYSSRHYDTDERLYSDFEDATGITVNRIEGEADELIARMVAEGRNSPADVFLSVDAGRMWRADQAGVLSPVVSDVLTARIPAALRHPEGHWFGLSTRARMIFFDRDRVAQPPETYADLADPAYEGMVCIRSSSNIYNQSLMGAMIAHLGPEEAEAWAAGVVANMARDPQGGDTDQLRGIISGECAIAVANSYYFARGLAGGVDGLSEDIQRIDWVFPDQDGHGAHVNISAGAVAAHAPNRDNAVAFLEYLASDRAQEYLAAGNHEYPVVDGVDRIGTLEQLGAFQADDLNLALLGENQPQAQEVFNHVGWE